MPGHYGKNDKAKQMIKKLKKKRKKKDYDEDNHSHALSQE